MKRFICATIASVVMGSAIAAEPAIGIGPPLSVLVVRSCGGIVTAYATWADGTVVAADINNPLPLGLVDALLKTAKDSKILDMDCTAVGHDSTEKQGTF